MRLRSRTPAAGIAIADKARNERNREKCCTDLIILWQRKGEEGQGREDSCENNDNSQTYAISSLRYQQVENDEHIRTIP